MIPTEPSDISRRLDAINFEIKKAESTLRAEGAFTESSVGPLIWEPRRRRILVDRKTTGTENHKPLIESTAIIRVEAYQYLPELVSRAILKARKILNEKGVPSE